MASVGVVTQLVHPVLSDALAASVVSWTRAYAKYQSDVRAVNLQHHADEEISALPLVACIAPALLNGLVAMGTFEGRSKSEDVTNADVRSWIRDAAEVDDMDVAATVKTALNAVTMRPKSGDARGYVTNFFVDIFNALSNARVESVYSSAEKPLIMALVDKLEPSSLRNSIKQGVRFWPSEDRYSMHKFQERVLKCAQSVMSLEQVPGRERERERKAPKDEAKLTKAEKVARRQAKRSRDNAAEGGGKKSKFEWIHPCLNVDVCKEVHKVTECPLTSKEKARELLDAFNLKRKRERKLSAKKVVASSARPLDGTEGRYAVVLEGNVTLPVLGDGGSDVTMFSKSVLDQVLESGAEVEVRSLDPPVKIGHAAYDKNAPSSDYNAIAECSFNLVIKLTCGRMRLRRVPAFIITEEMDEGIFGRPFLEALDFRLDTHLRAVRVKYDNADMTDLINSTKKLSVNPAISSYPPYHGFRFDDTHHDPVFPTPSAPDFLRHSSRSEIDDALQSMVEKAKGNGMSDEGVHELRQLLDRHRHVFRVNIEPDEPAAVEPMRVRLKPDARPVRSAQRRYPPAQRAFIISTIRKLEAAGAVVKAPDARWASPALAVPKPGKEQFRFTVDLRGPNAETVSIVSAMPNLEAALPRISGSTCCAHIDLCHAYWQIPLHPESRDVLSIQTPIGVFSPTRILQGSSDAGNYFQAATQQVFASLHDHLLQWLDDFLLFATSEKDLLQFISTFLQLCSRFRVKIHALKTELFATSVTFCGRLVDGDGMRFDPRRLGVLLNMQRPTLAGELQQLLCASNWMRTSLPEYSTVVAPLHALLETVYRAVGRRTRAAIATFSLAPFWGPAHTTAFTTLLSQIAAATKLAHPKPGHRLCLFTDASTTHWGAVLTQIPDAHVDRDVESQSHEPLAFLSGAFVGAAAAWSTPEKEAYAVVESMTRLDYLVSGGDETLIYTDHRSLLFIFDPLGRSPGINRATAHKLMRWALRLSAFRYLIIHLAGVRNLWADLLTRWAVRTRSMARSPVAKMKCARAMLAPLTTVGHAECDWPTRGDILTSQKASSKYAPKTRSENGLLVDANKRAWIPDTDKDLQVRLLIAAHCGAGGHRGQATTLRNARGYVFWKDMATDVTAFCQSCLHCLSTNTGPKVPRPLGTQLHASKPNRLLHMDYLYLGEANEGLTYLLILKDDFSSYCWLVPTKTADALETATALVRWFSVFGTVVDWVSDRGSHFKNQVVRRLREATVGQHHFTLAYTPQSNGTVEVVCRETLRALRALLSELQLPFEEWPSLVPCTQSTLNSTPLSRLGNRSPLTAMTMLTADSPLAAVLQGNQDMRTAEVVTLTEIRARQVADFERLAGAIDEMHKEVFGMVSQARQKRKLIHDARTNVRPANFAVGDFVLWGVLVRARGRKLTVKWRGPRRVVSTRAGYVYGTEDLRTGDRREIHGTRLKFFANSSYEITQELHDQLAHQEQELAVVEAFVELKSEGGQIYLRTRWKGFEEAESTWEPYDVMYDDVPNMVRAYIRSVLDSGPRDQQTLARECVQG